MNQLQIVTFLFLLLGCNHPESNQYDRDHKSRVSISANSEASLLEAETENGYKVIGIKDGDTFVVLIDGKEQVVRFAHIDCPEKNQPFGSRAKQFLSEMCYGKYVILIHKNKFDRNKRLIAEVILHDGTNLNKELVKNGLAWHYKSYSNDNTYADLENKARELKVGLWVDNNPIPPWTWRK
ncbi:MAG: thermonuclease family protein [Chitinophagaceae bacterium]|nr:thermonuclease family protein [Chitinophagaceae bacterium]